MAELQSRQAAELPPDYFLTNFWQVVDHVEKLYAPLLSFDERRAIKIWRGLPPDALLLYVRLINRKGPYFRLAKLNYLSGAVLDNAVQDLVAQRLIEDNSIFVESDKDKIINLFALRELQETLKDFSASPKKLKSKKDLYDFLREWDALPDFCRALFARCRWIRLQPDDPWAFLRFLHFGELRDNLSDFVVHALGHVTIEPRNHAHFVPLYASRDAALDCFKLQSAYAEFRTLRDPARGAFDCNQLHDWWRRQNFDRTVIDPAAHGTYDRFAAKLGQIYERADQKDHAIAIYRTSPMPPSRERLARLLIKQNNKADALALCETMLSAPHDDSEDYAARQLLRRLTTTDRKSDTTKFLQDAQIIHLNYGRQNVEQAALDFYAAQGWQGIHSENWLWNAFFGLTLWDIIFDETMAGFHHPLQFAPRDMAEKNFYARRRAAIAERVLLFNDRKALTMHVQKTMTEKNGISNSFVGWHDDLPAAMQTVIDYAHPKPLGAIVTTMAEDMKRRTGFPDLFLWQGNECRLVEVKSQNDQLSPQQLFWMQKLQQAGMKADVLRVHNLG